MLNEDLQGIPTLLPVMAEYLGHEISLMVYSSTVFNLQRKPLHFVGEIMSPTLQV